MKQRARDVPTQGRDKKSDGCDENMGRTPRYHDRLRQESPPWKGSVPIDRHVRNSSRPMRALFQLERCQVIFAAAWGILKRIWNRFARTGRTIGWLHVSFQGSFFESRLIKLPLTYWLGRVSIRIDRIRFFII